MKRLYQQGDVLLVRLDEAPRNPGRCLDPERGRYVLARGEHTGNVHAFAAAGVRVHVADTGARYVEVLVPADLTHGNGQQVGHHARTILPGWYEIEQVREIDPFSEETRHVED